MFLHLGADSLVRLRDVVGIFDLTTARASRDTAEFLELAKAEKRLISCPEGNAKAFVLAGNVVHLSAISSQTLLKRVPSRLGDAGCAG